MGLVLFHSAFCNQPTNLELDCVTVTLIITTTKIQNEYKMRVTHVLAVLPRFLGDSVEWKTQFGILEILNNNNF